jgi:hypothetical protein
MVSYRVPGIGTGSVRLHFDVGIWVKISGGTIKFSCWGRFFLTTGYIIRKKKLRLNMLKLYNEQQKVRFILKKNGAKHN